MKDTWDWILRAAGAFHDVRSYGAHGDGVADDTAAIQRAIAAAAHDGGGTVFLSAGTYLISASLHLDVNGLTLAGEGYASEIRNQAGARLATLVLVESGHPQSRQIVGVTIRDLRINGNRSEQSGRYDTKNIRLVPSTETRQAAMLRVENVWSHGAHSGWLPTEGGGISVEGSSHELDASAEHDYPAQAVTIRGCYCYDNGGWGIGTNWANGVAISDSFCFDNATMGITVWNSQDAVVSGNVCAGNRDYALNCEASARVTFAANRAESTGSGALKIYNSADVLVSGNLLRHNADNWRAHGVTIASGPGYGARRAFRRTASRRIQVQGNTIIATGRDGYGLAVEGPDARTPEHYQEDITIRGNVIRQDGQPAKGAAVLARGGLIFAENRVAGCVALDGGDAGDILCDGNLITAGPRGAADLLTVRRARTALLTSNILRCEGDALERVVAVVGDETEALTVQGNIATGAYHKFLEHPLPPARVRISGNTGER